MKYPERDIIILRHLVSVAIINKNTEYYSILVYYF